LQNTGYFLAFAQNAIAMHLLLIHVMFAMAKENTRHRSIKNRLGLTLTNRSLKMNEHDLCDSRKETPIQRAERVNATHYNEAKRIKKQLKAAMSDCLVWDNPNIPHRQKVVDGDLLYAKLKTIVDGISA